MKRMLPSAVVALLGILAAQARAQSGLTGQVTDTHGQGIPGADIALWQQYQKVAGATSATDGSFSFRSAPPSDSSSALVVRAIGYRPGSLSLAGWPGSGLVIRLDELPLALPDITIRTEVTCPRKTEAQALAEWARTSALYSPRSADIGIITRSTTELTAVAEPGLGPAIPHPVANGVHGMSGTLRRIVRDRVEQAGYAWPAMGVNDALYGWWDYAPLESGFAQHFLDTTFVSLQYLAMGPGDGVTTALRFCSKRHDRPYITGTLSIHADGTLQSATWRFTTRTHDEHAGGEVVFLPPEATPTRLLLPAAGARWWKLADGATIQRTESFEAWKLSDSGSIPDIR